MGEQGQRGKGYGKGVNIFGGVFARHPHQAEGGDKGYHVVETVYQAGPCNRLAIRFGISTVESQTDWTILWEIYCQ